MTKKRITLTLKEENVEWLDTVCNNRSGYMDDMLDQARKGDYDTESILTAFERQKLEIEEKQLERQLEAAREAQEELESARERQKRETWERALRNITPPEMRSLDTKNWSPDADDDAVEHYASELEITAEEFVTRYPEKREEFNA